jgi:hypothetical protein
MNDHDAIDAINAVLDHWFKGEVNEGKALLKIASISGQNIIDHEEAKRDQP